MESITRYGFASGATERTSTRILRSLPMGMRIIEPRSTAEALSWFGRLEVRIETAIGVDAGFSSRQISLPWVSMRSTNSQPSLLIFSSPFGSQKRFLPLLLIGDVGVHAAAVDADHRLGQEACGQSHVARHLAADQLVELDLVGRGNHLRVVVVDFELRRRDLGVIFFVLEAHGALDFGRGVDEVAQRVAGQRVIVAAGVHIFELAAFRDRCARHRRL